MEEDHGDEGDREAERVDEPLGQMCGVEDRLQQVGDGRLGDGTQGEGTDGDTELCGGHHLRQVLQAVQHLPGPARPACREGFDLTAPYGDEREFGADEEAVRQHEKTGEEQLHEAHRTASRRSWVSRSGPSGCSGGPAGDTGMSVRRTKRTCSAR